MLELLLCGILSFAFHGLVQRKRLVAYAQTYRTSARPINKFTQCWVLNKQAAHGGGVMVSRFTQQSVMPSVMSHAATPSSRRNCMVRTGGSC